MSIYTYIVCTVYTLSVLRTYCILHTAHCTHIPAVKVNYDKKYVYIMLLPKLKQRWRDHVKNT